MGVEDEGEGERERDERVRGERERGERERRERERERERGRGREGEITGSRQEKIAPYMSIFPTRTSTGSVARWYLTRHAPP